MGLNERWISCVISFFYIKPQLSSSSRYHRNVALYLSSTSNHNFEKGGIVGGKLRYIFLLHQTTTHSFSLPHTAGCVISFFYIKPQQRRGYKTLFSSCVISFFYIKPQLTASLSAAVNGCVISFFYIKPQHAPAKDLISQVALYLSSTSNHNQN